MQRRLPKPFALLLCLFFLSNYLSATPECPIVSGKFTGADGTTSDASATGWYLDASHVASTGIFAVKSKRLHAQELGGEGIWYSRVFSTSGYSDFQVAVKVTAEGDMNSSEYVKIYYKINGGPETLLDSRTGNFGTIDFTSGTLTGSNVQLVVKIYNYNNGGSQTSKYYIEEYRVFKEKGPCAVSSINVTAAAANGGILTCASSSLGLTATATGSGTTTWSWTGTNGFTSTAQNPTITAAGTYTVVATNSSGSGSASVVVSENKTAPVITATGGALACGSCVTISATSNVSGATYSWTGPGNFTSTAQNPTVCTAGTYTVTVTNPANGCSAQQTVSVTAGGTTTSTFWLEDFAGLANGTTSDAGSTAWTSTANGSGTYSVQNNEFKTSFDDQYEGVWTSQAINIAGKSNVTFSVDLRSEVTSGSFETADYIRVYYKLNGGAQTLVYEDLAGLGSTTTGTASATITSAALNGSTLQIIIKTSNSGSAERYYFDNIKVTGTTTSTGTVSVTPTVNGTVTCTATAQLSATASSPVSAWSWTGPNGFTSSVQNPVVSAGGQYVVTATLASGCSASSTITVAENKTAPDITATGGTLACSSGISLNVNSSVSGATYSWTGPNGFTSTSKNPTVSNTGTYTATVTNPANGCTASQAVTVTAGGTTATFWNEDFTLANGTTSDAGTTAWSVSINPSTTLFSVLNNEIRISNSTTTGEGVWSSAVMNITGKTNITISAGVRSSIINNAEMNNSGEYADYIRFYYKLNNGAEVLFAEKLGTINNHNTANTPISVSGLNGTSLQIVVRARATGNDEFYYFDNVQATGTTLPSVNAVATATNTLSCINNSVPLTGSSTTSGVSYSWTGPNNFTSTQQNPVVTAPGNYTLTVALGSCTANAIATVIQDTTHPVITATASPLQLTCTATPSTLTANSTTPGVNYSWRNSAGIIIASTASTSVTMPGNYTLTVTNPVNGCSSGSLIIVTQDTVAPTGITASHTGIITCLNPGISIAATVSSTGMNYSWTGPNGFTASTLNASITKGGTYIFTATNPTNGCTATASTVVEENTTPPGQISINNSGTINCLTSSVTISGSSSSSGVNYRWTSPNGFSSSSATATVMHGGLYTLTATNPANGCTSSKSTTVNENTTPPSITISNNSPISCANPVVTLSVVTNATNAGYLWLGDNLISDAPVVTTSTAGLYILTVTDQISGCSNQELVEVTEDYSDCGARKATNSSAQQNIQEVTVNSFTYKAYPNPVITNGVIEFTSPQSATATVSIYNALGACEKVLFKGTVMANRVNRVSVPATQLAAGAYYYIINSGGKSFTGKLVIVK